MAAGAVALAAAFSPLWWSQGVTNEVYGLHLLFLSLIFLLLIRLEKGIERSKSFVLLAYLVGLSFTNHLQTVLLFPTFLLLFVARRKVWKFGLKTFLTAALLFLLGFSVYLYLPIRSSSGPLADWGATSQFDNFIRHISGWQYRVWMFNLTADQVRQNFFSALETIARQFHLLFLPLLLAGLFWQRLVSRILLYGILLFAAITIFYNINYDIGEIDVYYLPAAFAFFFAAGIGALILLEKAEAMKKGRGAALAVLTAGLLFLCSYALVSGWEKADRTKNRFAQEAVENIYKSAPAGGLVFTALWDHYAPWMYNHFVLGNRPDVGMFDLLLARYSWYLNYFKKHFPALASGSEREIDSARVLIHNFEQGKPFNPAVIEAAYQRMLGSILRHNIAKMPVYLDMATKFDSAAGWVPIPEGVLFRLYPKLDYYPFTTPPLGFKEAESALFLNDPIIRREIDALARMKQMRESYERAAATLKSDGAGTGSRP